MKEVNFSLNSLDKLLIKILVGIFLVGLVYLLIPGPGSVYDFPAVPTSLKSQEPGDTIQLPHLVAFFSNFFREDVVDFYRQGYQSMSHLPFPPMRLNHPPEESYTFVKDQTRSTYLEELTYPLRDTLFVNGFEPFYQDGTPRYYGATQLIVDGVKYDTKATLRFYESPVAIRVLVWMGILFSFFALIKLSKEVFNG